MVTAIWLYFDEKMNWPITTALVIIDLLKIVSKWVSYVSLVLRSLVLLAMVSPRSFFLIDAFGRWWTNFRDNWQQNMILNVLLAQQAEMFDLLIYQINSSVTPLIQRCRNRLQSLRCRTRLSLLDRTRPTQSPKLSVTTIGFWISKYEYSRHNSTCRMTEIYLQWQYC